MTIHANAIVSLTRRARPAKDVFTLETGEQSGAWAAPVVGVRNRCAYWLSASLLADTDQVLMIAVGASSQPSVAEGRATGK